MATPKATTIKEALKRFEEKTKTNCTEATEGKIIRERKFTLSSPPQVILLLFLK